MAWFDDLKTPKIKTSNAERAARIPEGLWVKCDRCGEILQSKVLKEQLQVCPECDAHFRMTALDRLALFCPPMSGATSSEGGVPVFEEYAANLASSDPLQFDDVRSYQTRLHAAAQKTGLKDAFLSGKISHWKGIAFHLGIFEFQFMGGSMGVVVGEKVARVFEGALQDHLPAVLICASGGARMQEGIFSLMQMAKTTALIAEMKSRKLPYVAVLTDPTTGGVAASFAMLGDVILAEPGALIGFAGPRVIEQTMRQSLPEGFQRSEFLWQHGFVDRIVHRKELASELRFWLGYLGHRACGLFLP